MDKYVLKNSYNQVIFKQLCWCKLENNVKVYCKIALIKIYSWIV